MANTKITELTQYTNPVSTDVLPVVDVGADVTKKISIADLLKNASAGTAAAPGISFDGDSNTGIYSPGADQLALATNGTGRLFVASDGKVGVGTSSPDATLNVRAGSNNTNAEEIASFSRPDASIRAAISKGLIGGTINGIAIGTTTNHPFALRTNGTERFYITALGNVGIGTQIPGGNFVVSDNGNNGIEIDPENSTDTNRILSFNRSTSLRTALEIDSSEFYHTNNALETFRITSAGLVGVGTSSPATLMHLSSATGTNPPTPTELRIATTSNGGTWSTTVPWGRISFYSADLSGAGPKIHAVIDAVANSIGGNSNIFFRTSSDSADTLSDRMAITPIGVGIGTTSPQRLLEIAGSGGAVNVEFRLNATDGGERQISFNGSGSTSQIIRSTGTTDNSLVIIQGANERARIDSSGRLLVGTSTARANFSNSTLAPQFQVESTTSSLSSAALIANGTASSTNPYPRLFLARSRGSLGTNVVVVADDVVGGLSFQGNDGTDFVETASISAAIDGTPGADDMPGRLVFSTTADGASSPTERMRISNAGTTTLTSAASTAPFIANISTSEVARIDSSGRLLVGSSISYPASSVTEQLQLHATTTGGSSVGLSAWSAASASTAPTVNLARSRGAIGTHTSVNSGDDLGFIRFSGSDGSSHVFSSAIRCQVDGTPGLNDMPGRLIFSTTAAGSSTTTEALRITNDRVIAYNQAAPAAVNATATLTVANLKTGIITSTSAAATDMTLPTGTDTEAGFGGIYTNMTFEWSVINTGPSLVRVLAGTAHTIVGSGSVATGTSGRFASRRTAANTFVTYRLS